jgi:hypothetical protein
MDARIRREKIRLLQMKNRRKQMINKMEDKCINLTLASFLDIDYSIELIEQLFIKIDRDIMDKEEFKFEHSAETVIKRISKIKPRLSPELLEIKVILFNQNFRETGAITLKIVDAFKDINWIVDLTGYSTGRMDFIIIEPNLSFGICVERWEYQDTFINWGLSN